MFEIRRSPGGMKIILPPIERPHTSQMNRPKNIHLVRPSTEHGKRKLPPLQLLKERQKEKKISIKINGI